MQEKVPMLFRPHKKNSMIQEDIGFIEELEKHQFNGQEKE